jgi:hypothetical protein
MSSGVTGVHEDNDQERYTLIWKRIAPGVQCLIGRFRDVDEMLCFGRWRIVLETCKKIIQNNILSEQDPHDFDKALLWKVVTSGLDGDRRWRCVCTFFLAAAMEMVLIKKMESGGFKQQHAVNRNGSFSESQNPSEVGGAKASELGDSHKEIIELLKKIREQNDTTHKKIAETHNIITDVPVAQPVLNPSQIPGGVRVDTADSLVLQDLLKRVLGYAEDSDSSRQPQYKARGFHDDFQSNRHADFSRPGVSQWD